MLTRNLRRGPKNENNIGAAWIVFPYVNHLYRHGIGDYHLGRSEEEKMNNKEAVLIKTLEHINNKQSAAIIIQTTINIIGPLSEECAARVKELLEGMK